MRRLEYPIINEEEFFEVNIVEDRESGRCSNNGKCKYQTKGDETERARVSWCCDRDYKNCPYLNKEE